MLKRNELPEKARILIETLENESKHFCDLWSKTLKYTVGDYDVFRHVLSYILEVYVTMEYIIRKENNIARTNISYKDVFNLTFEETLTPITYERAVELVEKVNKEKENKDEQEAT